MGQAHTADLLLDARAELGEGAIWDPQSRLLYWVDINGKTIHAFDPANRVDRVFPCPEMASAVVVHDKGGLMLAVKRGFARFSTESGSLEMVAELEKDKPNNRFNDGKCDPAGRFWAGTMDLHLAPAQGSLYCLGTDGSARTMLSGVSCSNGIVWTRNARTMYYIDTPTREIAAFDFDVATGGISGRRVAIIIPDHLGLPDGMCIDADDNLWVAMWGGGAVTHLNPVTGAMLGTYLIPASQVTSCAFGGARLDELYVTTARTSLSGDALANESHAGGLFKLRPGVCGVFCPPYAG
jgi:sugar lactone lactonase YvrE